MSSLPIHRTRRPRRTAWWNSPRVRSGAFVAGVAVVLWAKPMGLLLWARLRILANIPRTAIADDESLALVPTTELPPLEATDESPVVVLPRAPSRNPFEVSTTPSPVAPTSPQQPNSPHSSNPKRTSNPVDGEGKEKSSDETADESASVHTDRASVHGAS